MRLHELISEGMAARGWDCRRSMDVQALAVKARVNLYTARSIVNGTRATNIYTAVRLLKALDIPAKRVYELSDSPS